MLCVKLSVPNVDIAPIPPSGMGIILTFWESNQMSNNYVTALLGLMKDHHHLYHQNRAGHHHHYQNIELAVLR